MTRRRFRSATDFRRHTGAARDPTARLYSPSGSLASTPAGSPVRSQYRARLGTRRGRDPSTIESPCLDAEASRVAAGSPSFPLGPLLASLLDLPRPGSSSPAPAPPTPTKSRTRPDLDGPDGGGGGSPPASARPPASPPERPATVNVRRED